jgi:predicted nucleic acid-binding Zn ribbon protein
MKQKRNNSNPVHIGAILTEVLKNCHSESYAELMHLRTSWESIVGRGIAGNTKPVAFKGKLVFVNVLSSIWLQQLQFLKKDIIRNINDTLGHNFVEDIKFNVGQV